MFDCDLEAIRCNLRAGIITREQAEEQRNAIWNLSGGRGITPHVWDKLDVEVKGDDIDR